MSIRNIKLIQQLPNIGGFDYHYTDEQGNKIASLLRNTNGKGYLLIMYIDIKDYVPLEIGSLMRGRSVIEKLLKENGYNVTNSPFCH
jgi:hypothetical protein